MRKLFLTLIFGAISLVVNAQCAMCRATLENNLSDGELEVGSSINTGILYLFVTPYLAVGLIALLWYRNSKLNAAK